MYTSNMDVGSSLNHDTTTSNRLGHTPFPLKFTPTCTCYTAIDAPICPSTASQGAQILCIHPIWNWDAVNGGLLPQPWHHNIKQARPYPIFPNIHPHQHMQYGMRVHPYAHQQHLKLLKHFVYIQYGCGMQSLGVCSLNHDTTTSYRPGHSPFFLIFTPTCTCNTA
jgi:hypothetical protein